MYRKSRAVALFLLSLLTVGSLTFGQAFAAGEDSRFDALKRFSQVLDIVERYYVKETPRPDLVNGALKGMLESLDPHSTMLSKEEFKDMQESTSGEFFGIGIEITMENNQLTVVTPIEDTPADKGGMKSGDIILAVGGKPTLEMTLQEAVSHIRGPKGSEVVLTILHRDSKEPVDLRIKRDAIPLISVKSRELEPGYYWVRLTRFSERTTQELLDALSDAKRKGPIKGIILDLRNNPGGLLDQAVSVSDAFLNKGVIVSMRGRQEETAREFVAKPQDTDPNFYIYTPDGKVRTYKVFSAGVVKDTADNYKLDYATDADYEAYLKLCEESSNYKVEDVELTAQSQIVSLSTCTNVRDDERFLVQGVLTAVD